MISEVTAESACSRFEHCTLCRSNIKNRDEACPVQGDLEVMFFVKWGLAHSLFNLLLRVHRLPILND